MSKKEDNLEYIRHSLAHLLAFAVLKKFPDTQLGIGPIIENGFYYDFLLTEKLEPTHLREFENEMRSIIKKGLIIEGHEITPKEAKNLFKNQPFKLELIKELEENKETLTVYNTGDEFTDLCKGGHVENTKDIDPDAFTLTTIAGAYWKGSEKNPQLQRIYGLAFKTKKDLEHHIALAEEAKKRDHRKLGKELELFVSSDDIGPGLPLFYPKGAILRRIVEQFVIELQEKHKYEPIWIPHITKGDLYRTSGHLEKYDALFPPMKLKDEADYYIKPMNCPHFMTLYKSTPHSYRELPIRWTAITTNYRYEKSGELSGLTRVRALTQDDCHVFATKDQIRDEINLMLTMINEVYRAFGLNDFRVRISIRDQRDKEKYIGDEEVWNESEKTLENLIKERDWNYEIGEGEAAFYGPKLDFIFKDVLGRDWQLSTIQLDMNLPKRFDLEYIDSSSKKQHPIVIHRAILGSTERFLGILIEHFGGAFPLWLAPIQVSVLPVSDTYLPYAEKAKTLLIEKNIRVKIDSSETLGKRIRNSELKKIPYILVVGEKEEKNGTVNSRHYKRGQEGEIAFDTLSATLEREISAKTI